MGTPWRPGHYHRLIQLRLVCASWNALIESTPTYWGFLSTGNSGEGLKSHILRSGNAPLDLWIGVTPPQRPDPDRRLKKGPTFLGRVLPLIPRWRSLCITEFQEHDLSPLIVAYFPILQQVQFEHRNGNEFLFAGLVQRNMPCLRSFISSRVSIFKAFTVLEGLTNIDICYHREDWRGRTSEDIHKVLSASPQLECLSLKDPYGKYFEDIVKYPPVALPLLVKLHIEATFTIPLLSQILSYLHAPACIDLKIGTIRLPWMEPPYPPLLTPALFDFAPNLMSRVLKSQSLGVVANNVMAGVVFRFEYAGNRLDIRTRSAQFEAVVETVNAMNFTVRLTLGSPLEGYQNRWCKLLGTTHITILAGYFEDWLQYMALLQGKEMAWTLPLLKMIELEHDESMPKEFVDGVLRKVSCLKKGEGRDGRHVQVDVTAVQGMTKGQIQSLETALYPTMILYRGVKLEDENLEGGEGGDEDGDGE